MGQPELAAAIAQNGRRAALLTLGGIDADAAANACAPLLRSADASAVIAHNRYVVFAPHLRETGGAADLAARMLAALPPGARADAAIGIALAPDDAHEWSALLAVAEGALGRAVGYVDGRFAFADAARDARWRIGPLLAGAIADALAGGQFHLVYQPVVRLSDGVQVGAEALIRWPRPGGETWPPAVFIPEAERRGLIEPITGWTFRAAVAELAAAEASGAGDFSIGVNLSAAMLGLGAADLVRDVLSKAPVDPARLMVEITETADFLDEPAALADVAAIRALGCGVAIDDFGAGRASLGYVVKLPANRIKLDASLIAAVATDPRARAAIAATARLAAEIGADVVAEGVQSAAAAADLATLGVGLGQGQFYGAPGLKAKAWPRAG